MRCPCCLVADPAASRAQSKHHPSRNKLCAVLHHVVVTHTRAYLPCAYLRGSNDTVYEPFLSPIGFDRGKGVQATTILWLQQHIIYICTKIGSYYASPQGGAKTKYTKYSFRVRNMRSWRGIARCFQRDACEDGGNCFQGSRTQLIDLFHPPPSP